MHKVYRDKLKNLSQILIDMENLKKKRKIVKLLGKDKEVIECQHQIRVVLEEK